MLHQVSSRNQHYFIVIFVILQLGVRLVLPRAFISLCFGGLLSVLLSLVGLVELHDAVDEVDKFLLVLLLLSVDVLRVLDEPIFDLAAGVDELFWHFQLPFEFLFCDRDDLGKYNIFYFLVLSFVLWKVDVFVYPPEGLSEGAVEVVLDAVVCSPLKVNYLPGSI